MLYENKSMTKTLSYKKLKLIPKAKFIRKIKRTTKNTIDYFNQGCGGGSASAF